MSSNTKTLFKFLPYLMLGVSIIIGFFMLYFLIYLFLLGTLIGVVIMCITYIKQKFFPSRANRNIKEIN